MDEKKEIKTLFFGNGLDKYLYENFSQQDIKMDFFSLKRFRVFLKNIYSSKNIHEFANKINPDSYINEVFLVSENDFSKFQKDKLNFDSIIDSVIKRSFSWENKLRKIMTDILKKSTNDVLFWNRIFYSWLCNEINEAEKSFETFFEFNYKKNVKDFFDFFFNMFENLDSSLNDNSSNDLEYPNSNYAIDSFKKEIQNLERLYKKVEDEKIIIFLKWFWSHDSFITTNFTTKFLELFTMQINTFSRNSNLNSNFHFDNVIKFFYRHKKKHEEPISNIEYVKNYNSFFNDFIKDIFKNIEIFKIFFSSPKVKTFSKINTSFLYFKNNLKINYIMDGFSFFKRSNLLESDNDFSQNYMNSKDDLFKHFPEYKKIIIDSINYSIISHENLKNSLTFFGLSPFNDEFIFKEIDNLDSNRLSKIVYWYKEKNNEFLKDERNSLSKIFKIKKLEFKSVDDDFLK